MSVRCGVFYEGKWHVFHTGGRHGQEGLFVQGRSDSDTCDGDGYGDLEIDGNSIEGDFGVFLPIEVCRAIAKWVANP